MKSFIILTLLSLAAAAATTPADLVKVGQALKAVQKHVGFHAAMNRGRRLNSDYMKMTCKSSVKGLMIGYCDTGSNVDSAVVIEADTCANVNGAAMKLTYTGTTITMTMHDATDCSDTGTSVTVQSEECIGSSVYYKIYEGKAILVETGAKSDCSDVTDPFGAGLYIASDHCMPDTDSSSSFKATCSSSATSVTYKRYSDSKCSEETDSQSHKDGECFASPAARAVPFVFVLLTVILASMLMQ